MNNIMAFCKYRIKELLTYPCMFFAFMLFVSCGVVDDEAMEQVGQTENTEQEENESDNNSNMESGNSAEYKWKNFYGYFSE